MRRWVLSETPLVSVVMAVYNSQRGLAATFESLEKQTFQDFEVVVVDDGSTDNTWRVISTFDRAWLRAHRHTENRGQTTALNTGIELARGKYIARHDAEDTSEPTRFEKQIALLEDDTSIVLAGTQVDWVDGNGDLVRHFEYPLEPERIRSQMQEKNSFGHGSVMVRRKVLEEAGGYRPEFRYAQDYDLWLRIAAKNRVANLPETLYKMRFSRRMASVARNREQNAYAALARRLHEERQQFGRERTELETGIAEIQSRFQVGRIQRRVEEAQNYVLWAERLKWWGPPADRYAWPMWEYALRTWPFSIPVWRFVARAVKRTLNSTSSSSSGAS